MSQKTVAAYGTWSSPISAEMVAEAGVRLSAPWIEDGVVWWLEGRAAEMGRVVLVRHDREGESGRRRPRRASTSARPCTSTEAAPTASIAASRSARGSTTSASTVSIRARIPFPSRPTVDGRRHRYADGRITPDGPLWIGVRERHAESDRSADVVNELVAAADRRIRRSRASSRAGATSTRALASHPTARACASSPGTCPGCRGTAASCTSPTSLRTAISPTSSMSPARTAPSRSGSPSGARRATSCSRAIEAAGGTSSASVMTSARALHTAHAEFGYPAWTFGASSYAFLDDGRIVCAFDSDGFTHFGVLDSETGLLSELDLGLDSLSGSPYVRAEGRHAVLVAGATTTPNGIVLVDVDSEARRRCRRASPSPLPRAPSPLPGRSTSRRRAG